MQPGAQIFQAFESPEKLKYELGYVSWWSTSLVCTESTSLALSLCTYTVEAATIWSLSNLGYVRACLKYTHTIIDPALLKFSLGLGSLNFLLCDCIRCCIEAS